MCFNVTGTSGGETLNSYSMREQGGKDSVVHVVEVLLNTHVVARLGRMLTMMITLRLTCPRGLMARTSADLCSFFSALNKLLLNASPFSLRASSTLHAGGDPDAQYTEISGSGMIIMAVLINVNAEMWYKLQRTDRRQTV